MLEVSEKQLETLLLCSFRYALGRKTYVVSEIAEQLLFYRGILNTHLRKQICDDIRLAIDSNQAGMSQDVDVWSGVLKEFEEL